MDDEPVRPDFFRRAIRRRWYVILVALLLGGAAVPAYLATATTEFRATSVVFLEPLVGNPYSPTTLSGRQEQLAALTTEAGLVLSDSVVRSTDDAAREADIDLGPRIQERTFTEVPSNSQVVNVSFTADTPEAAQFGAQALATGYLDYRRDRSEEVAATQLARLDQEIESLSSLVDTASSTLDAAQDADAATDNATVLRLQEQLRIYANQYGQLRIERVNVASASTSPGEVVSPARAPSEPEGLPAPLIAATIVTVLLGCGLVAAVVLEHLDSRLRSADEIESLGAAPAFGPAGLWGPDIRGTGLEDPYRMASISAQRGTLGLLGASGSAPIEVAAGLACTLADSGYSVVIVLATPDAAQLAPGLGLSDALDTDQTLTATQALHFDSNIHVLPTGTSPDDLPRLLHGSAFTMLSESLAAQYDFVILMGGSAGSAAGAAIARIAHGVVLVVRAGETRGPDVVTATRVLQASDARLYGALLTTRPHRKWHFRKFHATKSDALQALLGPARTATPPATRDLVEEATNTGAAPARRNGGS